MRFVTPSPPSSSYPRPLQIPYQLAQSTSALPSRRTGRALTSPPLHQPTLPGFTTPPYHAPQRPYLFFGPHFLKLGSYAHQTHTRLSQTTMPYGVRLQLGHGTQTSHILGINSGHRTASGYGPIYGGVRALTCRFLGRTGFLAERRIGLWSSKPPGEDSIVCRRRPFRLYVWGLRQLPRNLRDEHGILVRNEDGFAATHWLWVSSAKGQNGALRWMLMVCFVLGTGVPSCNLNQNLGATILQTVTYPYLFVLYTTSCYRATSGLWDSDTPYLP